MLKTTISMIPTRNGLDNEIEILMQKRMNNNILEWISTWEFPQGKLEKRPDLTLFDFAKYKLHSETGMMLNSLLASPGCWIDTGSQSQVVSYLPLCIITSEYELGIHFFVRGEGIPSKTVHAECHTWIQVKELRQFIDRNPVCSLNKPALHIIQKLYNDGLLSSYLAV